MTHPDTVKYIPIELIDTFPHHPYGVRDDDDMIKLVQSIVTSGITSPLILRKKPDGRYTLISGHRRRRASEILSLPTVPALVYDDISDDEAVVLMVDSNLSRENLLPSEKAFAYKMKLDAMKRQGKRNDLTSVPLEQKLDSSTSTQLGRKLETADIIGAETGESKNQVRRYIRLTYLIPELLSLVDKDKLKFTVGVDLSYLTESQQKAVFDEMQRQARTPSIKQSRAFKLLSQGGKLDTKEISDILSSMRLDDRVSFRLSPNDLEKLKNESGQSSMTRSKLLRSYLKGGGTVYLNNDVAKEIYGVHTDISRVGNLLKLTANRLRDICENPLIADVYKNEVLVIIEENRVLQDELNALRRKLTVSLEKLNERTRKLNNGDI